MKPFRSPLSYFLILLAGLGTWSCTDKGLFGGGEEEVPPFEGHIIFETDYELPPERQSMASMLPNKEKVYLKNGKSRVEREVSLGASMVLIDDPEMDSVVRLIDAEGMGAGASKARILYPRDSVGEPDIEKIEGEEKEIAGYDCKKAIVTTEQGDQKIETPVWYTEELKGGAFQQFKGLDGFPMSFKTEANGMKVEKTATEVVEEEVPDSLFNDRPEGFETMSMEEFQKKMGGGP